MKSRKDCFKIRNTFLVITAILLFFISPHFALANNPDVAINEIAWMGTDISSDDEWIELYNQTNQDIDLASWILKAADESPKINLSGIIAANGYFLLERTDDTSAPSVAADLIYTKALSNSGEKLELYDKDGILIDSADFSEKWLWGDNSTKQTMERTESDWQTSLNPGGTPKASNSSGAETPAQIGQPESDDSADFKPATDYPPVADAGPDITAQAGQEISFDGNLSSDPDWDNLSYFWNFGDGAASAEKNPSHTYNFPGQYIISLSVEDNKFTALDTAIINIYSSSVVISEFTPDQWIELYNQNDYIANLSGWKLNDFVFPDNTLIAPGQYLVLDQPDCSGDIQLFYPDGSLVSQVAHSENNPNGQCVAFDGFSYYWSEISTPGLANIISSAGLAEKDDSNASPAAKEVQAMPEGSDKIVLAQNNQYPVNNPATKESAENESRQAGLAAAENNILSSQTVNISQNTLSEQRAKMILVLSIIISGSLMVAWIMILIKKKFA